MAVDLVGVFELRQEWLKTLLRVLRVTSRRGPGVGPISEPVDIAMVDLLRTHRSAEERDKFGTLPAKLREKLLVAIAHGMACPRCAVIMDEQLRKRRKQSGLLFREYRCSGCTFRARSLERLTLGSLIRGAGVDRRPFEERED